MVGSVAYLAEPIRDPLHMLANHRMNTAGNGEIHALDSHNSSPFKTNTGIQLRTPVSDEGIFYWIVAVATVISTRRLAA